jgi:tetratricopeptide (TPR) repeat protein
MTELDLEKDVPNNLNDILSSFLGEGKATDFIKKVLAKPFEPHSKKGHHNRHDDLREELSSHTLVRIQVDHIISFTEKALNLRKHLNLLLELAKLSIQQGELGLASDIYSHVLYKTINNSKLVSERAYAFIGVAKVNSSQAKWNESITYLKQATKLFQKSSNRKGMADVHNMLGSVYGERGELKKSEKHFNDALKLLARTRTSHLKAMIETNIGITNNIVGDLDKAHEYYNKAMSKFMKMGDRKKVSVIKHNIGMLFIKQKEFEKALKCFNESISIALDTKYLPILAISYLSKAFAYSKVDELNLADNYLEQGLEISNKINDRLSIADIYKIKAIIHRKRKNYSLSENYFMSSLRINNELNNKLNYAETCFELGILYKETGNKDSLKYLTEAYKYYKKIGAKIELQEIKEYLPS